MNLQILFIYIFLIFMGNKTWLVALSLLALSQPGKIFAEHTNAVNAAVALQQAKEKVVTGEVSDDTGPVIGASVRVQGTTNGTITDIDGKFSLKYELDKFSKSLLSDMKIKRLSIKENRT